VISAIAILSFFLSFAPEAEGPEPVEPIERTTPVERESSAPAGNLRINLDKPGDREFIRDLANLIDEGDELIIRQQTDKLLTDTATPIIVVTIESMVKHGGGGLRIETFARLLFDQWAIGHAKVNNKAWNTGILLLVSRDDRKARIELGAGWGRDKDELCQRIMDEQIIPQFRSGAFSKGIAQGVEALDAMARSKPLPEAAKAPRPWWHYALIAGVVALAIFTAVSMIRRGSGGWAWLLWGAVFAIVGTLLYQMLTKSGRGRGGGGFGGGFSGGGGASGSW